MYYDLMASVRRSIFTCWLGGLLLLASLGMLTPAASQAEVRVNVSIWHGYDFYYPGLNLTSTNPVSTFHWMENASGVLWKQFGGTNGVNGFFLSNNLAAIIHECTNGLWKLYLNKDHPSEQIYYFKMSVTGVSPSVLGDVNITFPTSGSTGISTTPTYQWTGPSNLPQIQGYSSHLVSGNNYGITLPGSVTSWSPGALTPGENQLYINYYSNNFPGITFTTPTNSAGTPLADWQAQGDLHSYKLSTFTVAGTAGGGTLVAHYTFDDYNDLGADSSPNGYHMNAGGAWNGGDVYDSGDAMAGDGAVEFYTDGGSGGGYLSYSPTPSGLLAALAGDFSVSVWVKTTQSFGSSGDVAFNGAGILAADVGGLGYDLIPLALTEGEVAFNTGGGFTDHTVNSSQMVNDGDYHHIVVTRNQSTGEKRIYIDGSLEVSGFDDADALDEPVLLTLGALMDASESNPAFAGPYNGYEGLLDDLQIYSTALTPAQVDYLYDNPGEIVSGSGGSGGHTNLAHYRFDNNTFLGLDSSGQNNHFTSGSSWGTPVHDFDPNSLDGPGSVRFYGVSSIVHAPPNPVFNKIMSALANSFSVSLWISTEEIVGDDADDAFWGAPIIWAYDSGADDVIPVAITGTKVAFHTGDEFGTSETLHSTSDVTDGNYHHIVVTRDRDTGEKKIYVNGVLEATATGTTRVLNANDYYFSLGGVVAHSFDGYVDDLQIYSGVLSAAEVADLYDNPGTTSPDATGGGNNDPVDVEMEISISRNSNFDSPEIFLCFPRLLSVNIPETTQHRVESPNGNFDGHLSGSSSVNYSSLGGILNECTNGLWKLYINAGSANERLFRFSVNITDLTTNLLKPVIITAPANGSSNVSTASSFTWTGPVGFNGIFVRKYEPPFSSVVTTNMPGEATFWPSPPPLNPGTNRLYLSYHSNEVSFITFSTPVETGSGQPLNSWSAIAHINSDATSQFVVVGGSATPVQLTDALTTGGNLQFQFLSQAGRTHTVQSRTNLTTAPWVTVTNFTGNGSVMPIAIPIGTNQESYFRVGTQ